MLLVCLLMASVSLALVNLCQDLARRLWAQELSIIFRQAQAVMPPISPDFRHLGPALVLQEDGALLQALGSLEVWRDMARLSLVASRMLGRDLLEMILV